MTTISPRQILDLLRQGQPVELIDVRTPAEFEEVHVEFACNVPLNQLDPARIMQARRQPADLPLYVTCQGGGRAKQACEKFIQAGYPNVIHVEGGTRAMVAAGVPVVRGRKTISLERQVRITAGTIICIGCLLTWLVHPACLVIPAFIGAGLVFAGITDTCGMAMGLARMPWNQKKPSGQSCQTPV